jgi:P-type E1-E2 ATPase
MIDVAIPGKGKLKIKQLVLDLNGTIALDGEIIDGVAERLDRLSRLLDIFIITSDTMVSAERVTKDLKIKLYKIKKGNENAQKLELIRKIGERETVAIGNGSNDVLMLKESLIGICILGREGASMDAMMASDLNISDINDAFDLLLKPDRLVATLRK